MAATPCRGVFDALPVDRLLCLLCFERRRVLTFFIVRMNAQVDGDTLALSGSLDHATDRRGGEALSANENSDIRLGQNEAKIHLIFSGVADSELSELGFLDELKCDVLQKVLKLSRDLFHLNESNAFLKKSRVQIFEERWDPKKSRKGSGLRMGAWGRPCRLFLRREDLRGRPYRAFLFRRP